MCWAEVHGEQRVECQPGQYPDQSLCQPCRCQLGLGNRANVCRVSVSWAAFSQASTVTSHGGPCNEHGSLLRECDNTVIVNRRTDVPSGKQGYDVDQDLTGQLVQRAFASQPVSRTSLSRVKASRVNVVQVKLSWENFSRINFSWDRGQSQPSQCQLCQCQLDQIQSDRRQPGQCKPSQRQPSKNQLGECQMD